MKKITKTKNYQQVLIWILNPTFIFSCPEQLYRSSRRSVCLSVCLSVVRLCEKVTFTYLPTYLLLTYYLPTIYLLLTYYLPT